MRTLVVVNPAAGKRRGPRLWEQVCRANDAARAYECVVTERIGHARELAETAARAGYERVVAIGGDGTLCEVANGVAHTDTSVAVIPAGTGNDCCRSLRLPRQPLAAARLALHGNARRIDLGAIETARGPAYFVNVAGFGFDAEVARQVNQSSRRLGGSVPYVWRALQVLRQYQTPLVRISLDGRTVARHVFLAAVANGSTYGGGIQIAPEAVNDDGLFDVCVVGQISRRQVLRLVPRMYRGGHRHHPAVEFYRVRALRAESGSPVHCQADGELVGDLPVTFTIYPRGLQCVTGPGP